MTENDLCENLAIRICDISNGKEWDVTLAEEHKERHREIVQEEFLPLIRSYANALVAAAVSECAKGCDEILESREEDDAKGIAAANLCAMKVEFVTPESAAKELERIKVEARLEEITAIINGMDSGWTAAKVWAYIGERKAELEAAKEK